MTTAKAKKIRDLREARGMSVDELSRRMGVDEATVRRWESGEEGVTGGNVSQLADTLGASQDELRHEGDAQRHGE